MNDKFLSYEFARKHGLPFADTTLGTDERNLEALVARCGYPLIGKPRRGNGSRGVLVIRNQDHLVRASTLPDYVFQEYLAPPSALDDVIPDLGFGVPLFFALPNLWQLSLQAFVAPSGAVMKDSFCLTTLNVAGRPVRHVYVDDPLLIEAGRRYALALASIGWVGPVNVQGRRAGDRGFVAFELNGRLTGSTSVRLRLGFDDLGALAHVFAGAKRLAPSPSLGATGQTVFRSITDYPVRHEDILALKEHGVWRKTPS